MQVTVVNREHEEQRRAITDNCSRMRNWQEARGKGMGKGQEAKGQGKKGQVWREIYTMYKICIYNMHTMHIQCICNAYAVYIDCIHVGYTM